MAKRDWETKLPAPFFRRVWLEPENNSEREDYPFSIPFIKNGFDLDFETAVTIIVGENGSSKNDHPGGHRRACRI